MRTVVKVGGFGLGLVAVFAAATGVGAAVSPDSAIPTAAAQPADTAMAGHDDVGSPAGAGQDPVHLPAGLLVSQDGYTLDLAKRSVAAGGRVPIEFRIIGPDGQPLTGYQTEHDKVLHLIAVRRDLTDFQHVHPVLDASGTWSVQLDLADPGEYRLFADFTRVGHDRLTLGTDLAVTGTYQPQPLPVPAATVELQDGYSVALAGALKPGRPSQLTLTISRDGVPVTDLEPYLAAYGHLVALRVGDLAYLHVHPEGAPGDGVTPAGPGITFSATAPSAGSYRLFLDFQHRGVVRTAEFTVRATGS
jgi:hypothetical protein